MDLDALPAEIKDISVLPYSIHSSSGYTASYSPEHILVDNPSDQSSRWTGAVTESSARNTSAQQQQHVFARYDKYVMIKLDEPADVTHIGFGKYFKVHPCNLSSFAVYGGLSPEREDQHLLYYGGLRNDTDKEKFNLDTTISYRGCNHPFPIQYIRIDAIAAHSQSYNVSIWHVWLEGTTQRHAVEKLFESYRAYRDQLSSDMVLSYLRRTRSLALFESAKGQLGASSPLEHPLLSELHDRFVVKGDFDAAERLLDEMQRGGLFDWWKKTRARPKARWVEVRQAGERPGPRGGHQMVRSGRKLVLFGGWDGTKDLDDLWELDLDALSSSRTARWQKIECATKPRARSCHQMAVDRSTGLIYMLGGMAPVPMVNASGEEVASENKYANDFWVYDPTAHAWTLLSDDTASSSGPPLLFDHQMVVQPGVGVYVIGGKIAPKNGGDDSKYSTLWVYRFDTGSWTKLLSDASAGSSLGELRAMTTPCGRIGHAALYDEQTPGNPSIRVMSGQRGDSYMTDSWTLSLPSTSTPGSELTYEKTSADFTMGGAGPHAGFTQRLVRLDNERAVLLSGLVRDMPREVPTSDIWLCSLSTPEPGWTPVEVTSGPPPRYGAQCADDGQGHVYMSGGNPGDTERDHRLADLWQLSIDLPMREWAGKKAMFALRKQRFSELCKREPSVLALAYLQNQVSSVVDHRDPIESEQFRQCMKDLLNVPAGNERANEMTDMEWEDGSAQHDDSLPAGSADGSFYNDRHKVFEVISAMISPADRPPVEDLVDILSAARRNW